MYLFSFSPLPSKSIWYKEQAFSSEMVHLTEFEWIAGSVSFVMTSISLACTLFTLWLISKAGGVKSGYMYLLFSLTLSQLIYDVGMMFVPLYWIDACARINNFLTAVGGMATSLWSNVIALVVYYIVKKLRSFNINEHFFMMSSGITIVSLLLGVIIVATLDTSGGKDFLIFYYWFRFASIMVNVIVTYLIHRKCQQMGFGAQGHHPVTVLAKRLKCYPIVQTVARIGASWYELFYGFGSDSYKEAEHGTVQLKVALLCYAFFTPIAGIGFFLIFLLMQPSAYDAFRDRFLHCSCIFGSSEDQADEYQKFEDDKASQGVLSPSAHRPSMLFRKTLDRGSDVSGMSGGMSGLSHISENTATTGLGTDRKTIDTTSSAATAEDNEPLVSSEYSSPSDGTYRDSGSGALLNAVLWGGEDKTTRTSTRTLSSSASPVARQRGSTSQTSQPQYTEWSDDQLIDAIDNQAAKDDRQSGINVSGDVDLGAVENN